MFYPSVAFVWIILGCLYVLLAAIFWFTVEYVYFELGKVKFENGEICYAGKWTKISIWILSFILAGLAMKFTGYIVAYIILMYII